MSVRLNNYFNLPSLSASSSNESSSARDNKLFNWKAVAVSIGFLAAGVFLASYYSSDDIEVDESIGQTSIAPQVTSVAQDIALFVSAGIMPALELLGVANLVFRNEQRDKEQALQNALYQKNRKWNFIPDCMNSEECPDVDPELIYPPALEVASLLEEQEPSIFQTLIGRKSFVKNPLEMFRFCKDDPREKVLYISASVGSDHNGALNPFGVMKVLRDLHSRYDLKYQMVSSKETLRQAVQSGIRIGGLVHIYIDAHGNSRGIQLGNKGTEIIDRSSNFFSIFSGVPRDLVITLLVCEAGKPQLDGTHSIAQKIAVEAQRTVIAATDVVSSSHLTFSDSGYPYHPPRLYGFSGNVFIRFEPQNFMLINYLPPRKKNLFP